MSAQDLLSILSGSLVGFVLGLVGGGGSIIAVPLLLYAVGVGSTHVALGTSAIAVSLSALANLVNHARAGTVKWPCAVSFSAAGIAGAFAGSSLAMRVPGQHLLWMFGLLMLVIGTVMLLKKDAEGNPDVRLSLGTAPRLLPLLLIIGFAVGALSGFFGIGGGFLIVPGLMLATGMPIANAIGTSLVAVTAFGATTAANYSWAGLVDWRIAAFFIAGGVLGGLIGSFAGRRLAKAKGRLAMVFAGFVILIGLFVLWKGLSPLFA
ncbi:sulfite exporter TauE/SafE family protein [Aestuariivirga sp.]|uniref:sulfite exporter TauE/SafE family protein n=1 Tax=Aestuariivirga sp. TaxID=2650926 RepID=UPI00391CD611